MGRDSLSPPPIVDHPVLVVRPARPDEAAAISELAFRSKAHWGYDAGFMELCRADLTLSPHDIANATVNVFESDAGLAGFYRLTAVEGGLVCLDDLFVDPVAIGTGVGRRLWTHAVETARAQGHAEMEIQSDPYAEGFYRAMGARRIGEAESTVTPGRMLPLLRFALTDPESA